MTPDDALDFVRRTQGEPKGRHWRIIGTGGGELVTWGVVRDDPPTYTAESGAVAGEQAVELVKLGKGES